MYMYVCSVSVCLFICLCVVWCVVNMIVRCALNSYSIPITFSRWFIAFIAYCVVGMVVMRVKYDKTGTDVIPNKGLWFGLPSLVKVSLCVLVHVCEITFQICTDIVSGQSQN